MIKNTLLYKLCAVVMITCRISFLAGQFYDTGQSPSSLKWNQINTANYRVVFPESYNLEALRLAHLLEISYNSVNHSLSHSPKKIPVIVHNYSARSNGMVVWTPKRMELYPTIPQNLYGEDWLEHLVLHESRHVVQIDKVNQGFTKGLSFLFGEQAVGGIAGGMIPLWFFEGDAVHTETAFSRSGRGRQPSFSMELKALTLENKEQYSYNKMNFGSYKLHIPDHYQSGYQAVTFARHKYGHDIWDHTLNYVGRNPFTIFPFYFGLKKYAGVSKSALYRETFNYLDSLWSDEIENATIAETNVINRRNSNDYTNYKFPVYLSDSTILAEKSGLGEVNHFVILDRDGNEKKTYTPGLTSINRLTSSMGQIVWDEFIPDVRWENRNYSVLKRYDFLRDFEMVITHKSRYYAPALNESAIKVATIEVSPENDISLIILDSRNGELIATIPSPGNLMLLQPYWQDDDHVIMIVNEKNGKSIRKVNVHSQNWETVLDHGYGEIFDVTGNNDFIFFRSTLTGTDNIFCKDLTDGKVYQVTFSRYGAFNPDISPSSRSLVYADYSPAGYNIVETTIEKSGWMPIEKEVYPAITFHDEVWTREPRFHFSDTEKDTMYSVKPYRKWSNLFNFHSWLPFYLDYYNLDVVNNSLSPGLSLVSQNLLNTAFTTLGYQYTNKTHLFHGSFIYKGWYPVFELSTTYGGNSQVLITAPESEFNPGNADNLSYNVLAYLPLNLTRNKYFRGVVPSLRLRYRNSYYYYRTTDNYRRGIGFTDYRLYLYNLHRRSSRDIYPRIGQTIDIRYTNSPFENELFGSIFSIEGSLYLPGIFKHHGIRLDGSFQKQNTDNSSFIFAGPVEFPRGHPFYYSEGLSKISFNYTMPVWYPDINIGQVFYFKRLRSTFFTDFARGENVYVQENDRRITVDRSYRSAGIELLTDYHFAQIIFPFSSGIRFSYIPKTGASIIEGLFSVNLNLF